MEKLIRFIDLQATMMEDLFWSLSSYVEGNMEDGMKLQLDFLKHHDELEDMYSELLEEEKEVLEWIPDLMGINSERRTYLFYPCQE
jgi:hypothetical protein